jgi:hypothetical protein
MSGGLKLWMLACAVAVVAALLYGRFAPTPPDRIDALRLLEAPTPPVRGKDGSDAAWTLGYAVPLAERARVAAERRAYVVKRAKLRGAAAAAARAAGRRGKADTTAVDRVPDPLARYSKLPDKGTHPRACVPYRPGCLEHVLEDLPGTEALLRDNAAIIEAARELVGFDGIRIDTDSGWNDRPSLSAGRRLLLTAYATRFVRGEQQAALGDLCRDLAGWRRIGADADHPYVSQRAAQHVREDVHLLAQMFLERPVDAAPPETCIEAIAPTTDAELSLCGPAKREFRWMRAALALPPTPDSFRDRNAWLIDETQVLTAAAPRYAHYCSDEALSAAREDTPMRDAPPADACGLFEHVAHGPGCVVAQFTPGIDQALIARYVDRRMDQAQQIALLRVVLWSREHASHPREWKDLDLPRGLGFERTARFENGLCIDQHDQSEFERFCLPVLARLDGESAREPRKAPAAPTAPSPGRR